MGILVMGASGIYMLLPTVHRSQVFGDQKTRATQMASKMVENLQMLSANNLNGSVLSDLKLIDAGQSKQPYSFTNIPLDDGARYSPATALPKGKGSLTLTTLAGGSVKATVVITWTAGAGTQTYKIGTVVGGYR